jgi:hypothetical protein
MIQTSIANIKPSKLVSPGSRYLNSTVLYYGDQNFLTFTTYKRKPYIAEGDEQVMLITKGVEYRPDLVAYDYYGFSDPWWNILEANGMQDIYDFKTGITIILPKRF